MKALETITLLFTLLGTTVLGQTTDKPPADPTGPPPGPKRGVWKATPLDECSTLWQRTDMVTNAATGKLEPEEHEYKEISSGLNYLSASNLWLISEDVIDLLTNSPSGGAAAQRGSMTVYFPPSLADPIVSTPPSPQGTAPPPGQQSKQSISIRPVGLYWYDCESGKSALIGAVRPEAQGELEPPNVAVYPEAITNGISASITYTYMHYGFESDVVIQSQPAQPPEAWGIESVHARL